MRVRREYLRSDGQTIPSFERVVVRYTMQADDHQSRDEHEIEYDVSAGV